MGQDRLRKPTNITNDPYWAIIKVLILLKIDNFRNNFMICKNMPNLLA